MAATLQYYAFLVFLSTLWTIFGCIRMLIKFLKSPSKFFYSKDRPNSPEILKEGWNHKFIRLSDVNLHYVERGPSNKPLLLFLHGFPEFWFTWRSQLKAFEKDFRAVAVDMRGYGRSDLPDGKHNYSINKLTKDVNDLVHALGYKSCVLVGHDWGGIIAWYTVCTYPSLVDKMIILNAPHPEALFEFNKGGNLKQMLKSWYIFFFQCPILPEIYFRSNDFEVLDVILKNPKLGGCRNLNAYGEAEMEALKFTFSKSGLTPALNYYRAWWQKIDVPDLQESSPMVHPPTLLIWGTEDLVLTREIAEMSLKYCQNGDIRFVEGASHWVQEDEPDVCNKYMKEFLSVK